MLKKIVVGVLATIGTFAIIALGGYIVLRAPPHSANTKPFIHEYASPNGKYKAALISYIGGAPTEGGTSCLNQIMIIPASLNDKIPDNRYEVYSTRECDSSSADHSPGPKINWTSDSSVEITFSINSTALASAAVHLKNKMIRAK
jgi:hypothetical protein